MPLRLPFSRSLSVLLVAAAVGGGGVLLAQIEGNDRGIVPYNSSSNYEVTGVAVDVSGRTAEEARLGGWRLAQRKGWRMLYARLNGVGPDAAPDLSDGQLDSIIAGIAVEREQIGPRRYIARLGLLFDRARAGAFLGATGEIRHSAPMLVVPLMFSGGAATAFEIRNDWQRAWAHFRTSSSVIDYVRPVGRGAEPLLLTLGQTRRPGRTWWRGLLDQYGAADVLVPEVHLFRNWPGGPVRARFVGRHGPDGATIADFALSAPDEDALPAMLDEGVRRMDAAFTQALNDGRLTPDPSLVIEEEPLPEDVTSNTADDVPLLDEAPETEIVAQDFTVQVETPDTTAVTAGEAALRRLPGVSGVSTISLAIGGTSLVRLRFAGDLPALRGLLTGTGWRVEDAGGALRIRRMPIASPAAGGGAPGA